MLALSKAIIAAVMAGAATLAVPSNAEAAARPVYVDISGVPSSWATHSAVDWVDQYTGTNMVYGKCHSGYKCIRLRYKTIKSSWAAVTQWGAGGSITCKSCTLTIYLNPQRNGYSSTVKRRIIEHELGHANGIGYESKVCTNVMYGRMFCSNGKLPSHRFTDPQKSILRKN